MSVTIYPSEDMTVECGQTTGSLTSVDVSGGGSGLVFTGGPITSSGTITLSSGILTVPWGGTGFASATQGELLYGMGTGTLGHSSNLFWNTATNRLGIGTASPTVQLHTTDRAYIGTGVGTPPSNTPIMQVGDNAWGVDAGRYGISFGTDSSTLTVGDTYSGCLMAVKNSSSTNPFYVLSFYGKASTTTNIQALGTLSGNTYLENSTGSISVSQTILAYLTNRGEVTGGTRNVAAAIGVRVGGIYSAGTNNVTSSISYYSDGNATADFGGGGTSTFSAATVTNHIGFYATSPTTGTVTNKYAFLAEDKNAGSTIGWNSSKYAFYQSAPASRYMQTSITPWGVSMAGPKSVFMGRVGIGYQHPRFSLDVAMDDADSWDGVAQGARSALTAYVNPAGTFSTFLPKTGPRPMPLISTTLGRGTLASPQYTRQNDYLGGIAFTGYNSADAGEGAGGYIYGYADTDWSASGSNYTGIAIGTGKGWIRNNWYDRVDIDSGGCIRMYDQPFVRAYLSANYMIANATLTDLPFNVHNAGEQGTVARFGTIIHSTTVNPTRFYAPKAGVYIFVLETHWQPSASGTRGINILKFGSESLNIGYSQIVFPSGSYWMTHTATAIAYMAANDYVTFSVSQNSGGNLDVAGGLNSTYAAVYKLA